MLIQERIEQYSETLKETWFLPSGEPRYSHEKEKETNPDYYNFSIYDRFYADFSHVVLEMIYYDIVVNTLMPENRSAVYQGISDASNYGYLALKIYAKYLCQCERAIDACSSSKMKSILPLMTPLVLTKNWDNLQEITRYLTNSVNAKNCIIQRGDFYTPIAWFTLELLSKHYDFTIDKRKAFFPIEDDYKWYIDILEAWNTSDLIEVDKMVYILSDLHLQSEECNEEMVDEEQFMLLPYEIIVWMKLREKNGLENPPKFSHPLMNTPIVSTLIDLDDDFPNPIKYLSISNHLGVLQQKCGDFSEDIPSWLRS